MNKITIIGAGLAGCECALTLARFGISSVLYEQKPHFFSAAHREEGLGELVCSNSFRSDERTSGAGLLKQEMRLLGSRVMSVAEQSRVPAGKALAVDRKKFSQILTSEIATNPLIEIRRQRVESVDHVATNDGSVIVLATGPLTAGSLLQSLAEITGENHCYFYDAIAPIVWADSLDMSIVFRASRYGEPGMGDYLNCPMNREEYERFYAALIEGRTFESHIGENELHFEGCMPIEAIAAGGIKSLTFGPMKPVGLLNPSTGERPWAVLQLRAEDANMTACNLVGCQTKLLHVEQERIFRLVPGMENAQFVRFGSMHRNTYINAPRVLSDNLALVNRPNVYVTGQLSGVEGYVESAATGLWLGLYLAARARGRAAYLPPTQTALGALLAHLRRPVKNFQPSNVNFGLMPELGFKCRKADRKEEYAARGERAFAEWLRADWNDVKMIV